MEPTEFFFSLLLILVSARVFAELAVWMGAPAVIGELLAGVVLGPSLLGWLEPTQAIRLMAGIGIILLLFEVGLETDMRKLMRTGKASVIVAVGGFITPMLLGFAVVYWLMGQPVLVSLFIGGALTATSIGITVRVLTDLRQQNGREGQIVLGAAVLDDVLGVILLALLYEFSIGGGINLANTGKVVLFVAAFFVLAPIMARIMSGGIRRLDRRSEIPGLIPTSIVSLVLFFAWLAHALGAPELLGGFAAGLALSQRFFLPFGLSLHMDESFGERIDNQMKPIVQLFTPIFFVTVGLSLNLREIDWGSPFIWQFSLVLLIVAVVGKLAGGLMLREKGRTGLLVGTAMIPRGEVGLIFAELGRETQIFSNEIYAGLVIVIALTTLVPPFVMKWLYARPPPSESP